MYGILKKSNDNDGSSSDQLACLFAAPIAINSRKVAFASDTLSLKRVTSAGEAQRWEIETTIADSNNGVPFFVNNIISDINNIVYVRMPQPAHKIGGAVGAARGVGVDTRDEFLVSPGVKLALQSGTDDQNNLRLGIYEDGAEQYPKANPLFNDNSDFAFAKGTGVTQTNVGQLDSTVVIELGSLAQLFLGSFIRFENHKKIYMIKSFDDLTGNNVTVQIYPKLYEAVNSGTTVYLGNNVIAEMNYEVDSIVGMRFSDGIVSSPGTVRLVEAL